METSILKALFKDDFSVETAVASGIEKVQYYLELWGRVDLIIFGLGLENNALAMAKDQNIFEGIKNLIPEVEIILVSSDEELLRSASKSFYGQFKETINLSPKNRESDSLILQKIKKILGAETAKSKAKIPGIFLVDDEESILTALKLVLLNGGFNKVYTAGDSEGGLKVFKENFPDIDVCLIDYNLRGQTAENLIYAIHHWAPDIKIFILSGEGKNKRVPWPDKILKICTGFLDKPFDIGEIVLAIDEALKNEVVEEEDLRLKVLVIDDSPETGQILEGILGEEFQVVTAADGETGLEKFKKLKPELVILDYKLPGMNGLEVMNELNSIADKSPGGRNNLKVVVTTIERDPQVYTEFMKLRVSGFLYKPIQLEDLEEMVRSQLADNG
jgi:DNA-binding NarL/FixJ family response regulator